MKRTQGRERGKRSHKTWWADIQQKQNQSPKAILPILWSELETFGPRVTVNLSCKSIYVE